VFLKIKKKIMSKAKEVKSLQELQDIIKKGKPVLADFYAPWCGPCKVMGPMVDELAGGYSGKVEVVKVNIDEVGDAAREYSVQAVPTLIIFYKKDKIYERLQGMQAKNALMERLDSVQRA
jgi:thioredoxin 1